MSNSNGSYRDFRTFSRRLILMGTLRVETSLRIGSGKIDELSGADIAVMKDGQRMPFIPGSSFKGALRAHVERLVRGLWPDANTRLAACDPLTEAGRCIPGRRDQGLPDDVLTIQDLRKQASESESMAASIFARSCRVCRVFGSPWLASKSLVKDLSLKHPEFWFERGYQVRMGVGIERDSEAAQKNVLYSGETVQPGTEFTWEIMIDNADPQTEEPLVFLALREMANGHIPLGGAKSRGLGCVSLSVASASLVDRETLADYLINQKPRPVAWSTLEGSIPDFVRSLASSAIT